MYMISCNDSTVSYVVFHVQSQWKGHAEDTNKLSWIEYCIMTWNRGGFIELLRRRRILKRAHREYFFIFVLRKGAYVTQTWCYFLWTHFYFVRLELTDVTLLVLLLHYLNKCTVCRCGVCWCVDVRMSAFCSNVCNLVKTVIWLHLL